jgi:hypothetical protein
VLLEEETFIVKRKRFLLKANASWKREVTGERIYCPSCHHLVLCLAKGREDMLGPPLTWLNGPRDAHMSLGCMGPECCIWDV